MIAQYLKGVSEVFFPDPCKGCGQALVRSEEEICMCCEVNLPNPGFFKHHNNPVDELFWGRLKLEYAGAWLVFKKKSLTQKLLHDIKYRGAEELGHFLGICMGKQAKRHSTFEQIDGIVPVPLHRRKMKIRGFNQAEIIANGFSEATGIPVLDTLVCRNKHTETQTKKSRWKRWQNVEHVFAMDQPEVLEGKHLLILDDVITTGSTIEACARPLLQIPNVKLSAVALAYPWTNW